MNTNNTNYKNNYKKESGVQAEISKSL